MSPQRRSPPLRLQALEARDNPATFGETWYDPTHLTLSFAPDGTSAVGTTSTLSSLLSALGPAATFQILKAFQTWAVQTNINIGLVSDSGAAFDESGALQGDLRYGDIRLGACALYYDVVALSTTSGNLTSSAGDIVLNSLKTFSLNGSGTDTYDLFTVMLQEAGHAFGLPNSTDTSSVMYEDYTRALNNLSSSDVTAIQSLYGVRKQDIYEGLYGNNSMSTATAITGPITADLTTASGVDWYKFVNTTGAATTVRLQASGLSLLTARLEVSNAYGTRVGYAVTTDPLNNDLIVTIPASYPGAVLYIKVSAGRSDVFGIGAYRLTADCLGALPVSDPYALVDGELGANDLLATAGSLTAAATAGTYFGESSLASATDADYFRVTAPTTSGTLSMTVSVAGAGRVNLAPTVEAYAADGLRLSATVLSVSGNNLVLSVAGVASGATYYVRVGSASGAVANYDVAVAFRTTQGERHGSNGTMTDGTSSAWATMTVYQTQVVRLSLSAAATLGPGAQLWVRVYDSQNQLVFQMPVAPGQASSQLLLLKRGTYRLELTLVGTGPLPDLAYDFQLCGLTDPEGATLPGADQPAGGVTVLPPPPSGSNTITIIPGVGTWF